jgi:hypothetical protein
LKIKWGAGKKCTKSSCFSCIPIKKKLILDVCLIKWNGEEQDEQKIIV